MSERPIRRRTIATGAALAAGSLMMAGCASGSAATAGKTTSLPDQVPEKIRKAGVLKIASDLSYAPVESLDRSGKAVGLDPDLAAAIGRKLGLRVEITNVGFDKILNELEAGKYDIVMSAMTDNKQRREGTDALGDPSPGAVAVDFVDYFIAGTSILVRKGNPENINGLNDLCGKTIAIQKGTTQEEIATRQQVPCKAAGKPLRVMTFGTDAQAVAQLRAGNAVADMNDFPVAVYNSRTVGGGRVMEVTGPQMQPAPYGIAVRKTDTQLRDLLARTVDQLIISGEYDKILAKWNLTDGAAQNAVINGG